MQKEKTISIRQELIVSIIQFTLIIGMMLLASMIKNQFITGTIVNALFLIATVLLGLRQAIVIAFIPSMISYFTGLLPAPLGAFIPFIITGNIVLISIFYLIKNKNIFLSFACASVAKFAFLFLSSSYLYQWIIGKQLSANILLMMSWPQLVTAILGSILAFLFLTFLKKRGI